MPAGEAGAAPSSRGHNTQSTRRGSSSPHVQPHHRVLDMCAAPGSKTFQLLEALHGGEGGGEGPALCRC